MSILAVKQFLFIENLPIASNRLSNFYKLKLKNKQNHYKIEKIENWRGEFGNPVVRHRRNF
jgi:hypothetical protein